MAKVGAQRAADLTGKSKSTIQRAMNSGKLSYEVDPNGRRLIDVSELERAFGLSQAEPGGNPGGQNAVEAELKRAAEMLDSERMRMRIRQLEDKIHTQEEQIEDLKNQRDQWQKQAQQVLITSQYSQREAEALKQEMKERERKYEEKRQQFLARKEAEAAARKAAKAENENSSGNAPPKKGALAKSYQEIRQEAEAEESQEPGGGEAAPASSSRLDVQGLWNRIKERVRAA